MSLLAKIKADQLDARKNKLTEKASLLTTLIGEATMVGKNDGNRETTDVEVIAIIKKFVNNIQECLKVAAADKQAQFQTELNVLNEYLPKQMSDDDIKREAELAIVNGAKNIGAIMNHFKNNFAGTYDGKVVSNVAKQLLG